MSSASDVLEQITSPVELDQSMPGGWHIVDERIPAGWEVIEGGTSSARALLSSIGERGNIANLDKRLTAAKQRQSVGERRLQDLPHPRVRCIAARNPEEGPARSAHPPRTSRSKHWVIQPATGVAQAGLAADLGRTIAVARWAYGQAASTRAPVWEKGREADGMLSVEWEKLLGAGHAA